MRALNDIKKSGEVQRTSPPSGVENPPVSLWSFCCRLIVPAFSQQVFLVYEVRISCASHAK